MAFTRSYYWRAVRELARETGQTIKEARRGDWQGKAQAERDRRVEAARRGEETKERRRSGGGGSGGGGGGWGDTSDWIVEEPIDTVGGAFYE